MSGSRRPLLVLLGSGASIEVISGVAAMTERLMRWDEFGAPEPGDGNRLDSASLLASVLDRVRGIDVGHSPFFRRLREILGAPRSDKGEGLNFEVLIQACDELGRALATTPEDRVRWLLDPFFEIRRAHAAWCEPGIPLAISRIAEEARYFVLEHIATECERAQSLPSIAKGIRTLADQFLLRIHSLNYDDLPLAAGLDLYTGFEKGTGTFRPDYPWPDERHGLAQLHGSVRWALVNSEIRAFDSIADARANRTSRINHYAAQDGHLQPLAPMITGLRKADGVLDRPYGTYLHVFRHQLLQTPRWLIIGYGFGDAHVNHQLRQAWANWELRGQRARLVVVDYLPSAGRNDVAPGATHTRTWEKIRALLEPAFREDFRRFWDRRFTRKSPPQGLFRFDPEDRIAVHFDGGESAMTGGIGEIANFFAEKSEGNSELPHA